MTSPVSTKHLEGFLIPFHKTRARKTTVIALSFRVSSFLQLQLCEPIRSCLLKRNTPFDRQLRLAYHRRPINLIRVRTCRRSHFGGHMAFTIWKVRRHRLRNVKNGKLQFTALNLVSSPVRIQLCSNFTATLKSAVIHHRRHENSGFPTEA